MTEDTYVPMNELIKDKSTVWVFTQLNIPYIDIAKYKVVMWCMENIQGRWTMLGGNKFGFEDAGDATMFKIQFGMGQEFSGKP